MICVSCLISFNPINTGNMKRILLLFSLFAFFAVLPVHAAPPAEERMLAAVPDLLRSLEQGNTDEVLKTEAGSLADRTSEGWLRNILSTDKGVTEISLQGIASSEPVWSFLFLRPISESNDLKDNTFFQGSVFRQDGRTTLNGGLGYRRLVADERVLLGANLFYDHEFPRDHQRMSVGGEIRTTVGELNANLYHALSGWKDDGENFEERALGGYDVEAALALPYIPSAHLRYKHFSWNGIDEVADLKGNTFSLTGSLYRGLMLELGYTDYSSGYGDYSLDTAERFVKVSYNVAFGGNDVNEATRPHTISQPWCFDSMVDRRFEKVRRENRIIKARRSKAGAFAVTVTGF